MLPLLATETERISGCYAAVDDTMRTIPALPLWLQIWGTVQSTKKRGRDSVVDTLPRSPLSALSEAADAGA